MIKYLNNIKANWIKTHTVPLLISTPSTIADIETISVAIPNSYFRAREAQFPATRIFSAVFMDLIQLGISRLSFTRYEDIKSMNKTTAAITEHSMADFMRDLLDAMDHSKSRRRIILDDGTHWTLSRGSDIAEIAFEWGGFDGALGDEDLILPYYAVDHAPDRTMELNRDHICGPATGAIWRRREYTWYGQVLESFWEQAKLTYS